MIPMGNMAPFGAKIPQYTAWNPSDKGTGITLSNGNRTAVASAQCIVRSVLSKSSGKWYWELTIDDANYSCPGISDGSADLNLRPGFDAFSWAYQYNTGNKVNNGSATAYGAAYTLNDVLGFKLDADAGTVEILLNNASQGTITLTGLTRPYYAMWGSVNALGGGATANFGSVAFAYSVPAGYNSGLYS